jgi:hypothetical protein
MMTANQVGVLQPPVVVVTREANTVRVTLLACAFGAVVVDVVLDVAVPAAVEGAATAAPVLELDAGAVPCDVPGEVATEEVPAFELAPDEAAGVVAAAELAGTKRPVRFQKAEKPLNGPPTTWLDHCSV